MSSDGEKTHNMLQMIMMAMMMMEMMMMMMMMMMVNTKQHSGCCWR